MQLGVKGFTKKKGFRRGYASLDRQVQLQVEDTIDDLRKNPIPNGRQVKKMEGYRNPDIWEARVNGSIRLTFTVNDGIVTLRNVGTHQIYESP